MKRVASHLVMAMVALTILASCSSAASDVSTKDTTATTDATSTTDEAASSTSTTEGKKSSTTYRPGPVEDALKDTQKNAVGDLELGEAKCPEDIEMSEGVTFTCTLEVGDVNAPYTVDLTGVDTDSPRIHVVPTRAIIDVSKAVAFVRSNLAADFAGADVTCGNKNAVLADPGDTIDCSVVFEGETQAVKVVVKDVKGTIALQP